MIAYVFPTNQEVPVKDISRDEPFSLSELQELVGGYIQVIGLKSLNFSYRDIHIDHKNLIMILNEEGKIRGLQPNMAGTVIMRANGFDDFAVGDVIVCDSRLLR
tara:strand:- start:1823 stop:2134 length:312 start_codon:yes stop_codon:yes gene_type:complete